MTAHWTDSIGEALLAFIITPAVVFLSLPLAFVIGPGWLGLSLIIALVVANYRDYKDGTLYAGIMLIGSIGLVLSLFIVAIPFHLTRETYEMIIDEHFMTAMLSTYVIGISGAVLSTYALARKLQ